MENRNGTTKIKRKLHRGRFFVFLIVLSLIVYIAGIGVYQIYIVGQDVFAKCDKLVTEFKESQPLMGKYQAPHFNEFANILLIGVDGTQDDNLPVGQRADALILLSINKQTGLVNVVSLPRNTKVSIPGRSQQDYINQSYYYGGAQLTVRTVEDFLEIPINHYIAFDIKAFTEVLNVFGGSYLYVEHDMDYDDPQGNLAIHLKQGYQYLDAESTMNYLRYRSDELGDIGRVQRQQKFIKQFYEESFRVDTVFKIPQLLEIADKRVVTSLAASDVARLVKYLVNCPEDAIKTVMLPGITSEEGDKSYWQVDLAKKTVFLEKLFMPNQDSI